MGNRVNDVPNSLNSIQIRVVGQQFTWNIHYPGPDNIFGATKVELVDEAENQLNADDSDKCKG